MSVRFFNKTTQILKLTKHTMQRGFPTPKSRTQPHEETPQPVVPPIFRATPGIDLSPFIGMSGAPASVLAQARDNVLHQGVEAEVFLSSTQNDDDMSFILGLIADRQNNVTEEYPYSSEEENDFISPLLVSALEEATEDVETELGSNYQFSDKYLFYIVMWGPTEAMVEQERQRKCRKDEALARLEERLEMLGPREEAYRGQSTSRSSSKGPSVARGGPSSMAPSAPPAPVSRPAPVPVEMAWSLVGNGEGPEGSYPFREVGRQPGFFETVVDMGRRVDYAVRAGKTYEVELGSDFVFGLYVPSLTASGKRHANTFGPYAGLRDLYDFSFDLIKWAEPMTWYFTDKTCMGKGDPHGLMREPVEDTIKKYSPNSEQARTAIRIESVSGVVGARENGTLLEVAAAPSQQTAACKYTNEGGQRPRFGEGVLEVLCFRIKMPPGKQTVFSDGICVSCLEQRSTALNAKCGHVCLCRTCFLRMREAPCPLCREIKRGVVVGV